MKKIEKFDINPALQYAQSTFLMKKLNEIIDFVDDLNNKFEKIDKDPIISEFTKDELQHIKDHLSSSFRGFLTNSCHFEGEYRNDLEKSIKRKLGIL